MRSHIVTGLDIGTGSVRAVVCEYNQGSSIPEILAMTKRNSRGLRRGYIVNIDEAVDAIAQTLSEAEKASGVKIKNVVIGTGGISLETKTAVGSVAVSRADSEITDLDIDRALDASQSALTDTLNKEIIHRFPIGFKVDGQKIYGRVEGLKGSKLEADCLFVTYSAQHLRDMIQAVEMAGYRVAEEDIVASPLAASIVTLNKMQKMAGCVLANIGSQTTSIAIFEEGLPLSINVFPIGSTDITNDIALGLKITLEEAEQVKRKELDPLVPKKKLDEIVDARLSDIFEFIEGHLKKMGRNGLLPAGIILTGGGSGLDNISDQAKSYFRLPARTADESVMSSSKNQIKDSAWAVAYGLCIFGSESDYREPGTSTKILSNAVRYLKELLP